MRIFVLCFAAALVGCQCKEAAKPAPNAVSVPAELSVAATAPIEGALAYPFTQADSKLTWVGQKITGKHEGAFATFGGIIELVDGNAEKSRVRAEIDMDSLQSEPEKLVGHLKSADFFSVQEFPRAAFVSTAIAKSGEAYSVTGNLTMHGVMRAITFPATIGVSANEVTVNAEFAINRKDFGIVYPGKPDDLIADDVALKLEIHAKKRAAH